MPRTGKCDANVTFEALFEFLSCSRWTLTDEVLARTRSSRRALRGGPRSPEWSAGRLEIWGAEKKCAAEVTSFPKNLLGRMRRSLGRPGVTLPAAALGVGAGWPIKRRAAARVPQKVKVVYFTSLARWQRRAGVASLKPAGVAWRALPSVYALHRALTPLSSLTAGFILLERFEADGSCDRRGFQTPTSISRFLGLDRQIVSMLQTLYALPNLPTRLTLTCDAPLQKPG